jgi:hypothetical protein
MRFLSLLLTLFTVVTVSGCVSSNSYMGINVGPNAPASSITELARLAQAGEKQAQLELGISYDKGRGVARDLLRAEQLYALAAEDSHQTTWVYMAAPGGSRGRLRRRARVIADGLPDAAVRLGRLRNLNQAVSLQHPIIVDDNSRYSDDVLASRLRMHGFRTLFGGLAHERDWRVGILISDQGDLMTRQSLDDTLLFLMLSPEWPETAGQTIDPDLAQAFCRRVLEATPRDIASLRRGIVCIAGFPELAREGLGRLRDGFVALEPAGHASITAQAGQHAQNAALFYRALRHCQCGSPELLQFLIETLIRSGGPLVQAVQTCPEINCPLPNSITGAANGIAREVLLALIESPDVYQNTHLANIIGFSFHRMRRNIIGRPPIRGIVELEREQLHELCTLHEPNYDACRARYPYSGYLQYQLGIALIVYHSIDGTRSERCRQLALHLSRLEGDLIWQPEYRPIVNHIISYNCPR